MWPPNVPVPLLCASIQAKWPRGAGARHSDGTVIHLIHTASRNPVTTEVGQVAHFYWSIRNFLVSSNGVCEMQEVGGCGHRHGRPPTTHGGRQPGPAAAPAPSNSGRRPERGGALQRRQRQHVSGVKRNRKCLAAPGTRFKSSFNDCCRPPARLRVNPHPGNQTR
jgi:hypothetical protein